MNNDVYFITPAAIQTVFPPGVGFTSSWFMLQLDEANCISVTKQAEDERI